MRSKSLIKQRIIIIIFIFSCSLYACFTLNNNMQTHYSHTHGQRAECALLAQISSQHVTAVSLVQSEFLCNLSTFVRYYNHHFLKYLCSLISQNFWPIEGSEIFWVLVKETSADCLLEGLVHIVVLPLFRARLTAGLETHFTGLCLELIERDCV